MKKRASFATEAAREIWQDCLDRQGLKYEFRKVPGDVKRREVIPQWAAIIRAAAKKARDGGAA